MRSSSSSTLHSKAKPYSFRVRNRERVRERLEEVLGLSATLHLYLDGCELLSKYPGFSGIPLLPFLSITTRFVVDGS